MKEFVVLFPCEPSWLHSYTELQLDEVCGNDALHAGCNHIKEALGLLKTGIRKFLEEYEGLYGKESMSYKADLLIHLLTV